jgi:glycerophosphoryl diester phosphodiesterase
MKRIALLLILLAANVSADFKITSHKTAGLEEPENSMAGLVHSLNLPVQGIEIDLHLTKDKELVLAHDPVFDNVNCFDKKSQQRLIIKEMTLKEVQALDCFNHHVNKKFRVPTFKKALEIFAASGRTDIELNIEVKALDKLVGNDPRYKGLDKSNFYFSDEIITEIVLKDIRDVGIKNGIMFSTFSQNILLTLKKNTLEHEDFRFALLYKGKYAPVRLGAIALAMGRKCWNTCWWVSWRRAFHWMEEHKIDVFMPHWPQIDNFLFGPSYKKWMVRKERSFEVLPWTPNETADWEKLKEINADGIVTDRPAAYIQWLETTPK